MRSATKYATALVYVAIVLAQTLVLPLLSGIAELLLVGGDPILVLGRWWSSGASAPGSCSPV